MTAGRVLLTGATGYIGARVAATYLEHTDSPLELWLHAGDRAAAEAKAARLRPLLDAHPGRARLSFGDLTDDDPFAAVDRAGISAIVHSAAVTRFNVDRDTAERANVRGTEQTLRLAAACPALESIGLVSTIYASGMRAGRIQEQPAGPRPAFANHYEWSKWEAEQLVWARFCELPVRVLRLATVIADDEAGRVEQYNAFHNTLKLFFYGLLSLLPGELGTPLYFTTGRFAAEAIVALVGDPGAGGVYHLAPACEDAITLERLVALAFARFGAADEFRRKRILAPVYADADAFDLLASGVTSFGGSVVNQALSSVVPFARQLFVRKDVRNARLRAALPGARPAVSPELIERTCDALVRTRWGRHAAA